MDDPKFCVNCAHFNSAKRDCEHPTNKQKDLVRGGFRTKYDPGCLRHFEDLCGPTAKWFVAKVAA